MSFVGGRRYGVIRTLDGEPVHIGDRVANRWGREVVIMGIMGMRRKLLVSWSSDQPYWEVRPEEYGLTMESW